MPNYLNLISQYYPNTQVYTAGDPTVYNDIVWVSAQIPKVTLDGLTEIITGDRDLQTASNDLESSTTSTSWIQKITMTTPALMQGTYRIAWYAELKSSSTNNRAQLQVQINNTTTIGNTETSPKNTTDYMLSSGFYYYTGSGQLTIDMDYSSTLANATTYVRRARLEIWRVI